jgi:hypothetical protein
MKKLGAYAFIWFLSWLLFFGLLLDTGSLKIVAFGTFIYSGITTLVIWCLIKIIEWLAD